MDGKIDKIREALEEARDDFKTLAHSHDGDFDEAGLRNFGSICERQMDEAIAALSAIDPEAIRREACTALDEAIADLERGFVSCDRCGYEEPSTTLDVYWMLKRRRSAILSAEPAQDDGKPEDESLQETLDRMDGYGIDNECGARG